MNNQVFLLDFMDKIEFPKEAKEVFKVLHQKVYNHKEYQIAMDGLINSFMEGSSVDAFAGLDVLASEMKEHTYTMSMLLLILSAKPLLSLYHEKGISTDIYIDSMKDLTYKLAECYELHRIWGTFVREWYPRFYLMERFALGRIQYEYSTFRLEDIVIDGHIIKKGDKVLNMHIPSSGSFGTDKRLNSYKKAYDFYEKDFDGKPIPFVCDTWLLYPKYQEIIPQHSNILGFYKDFTYVYEKVEDEFHDAWRIFGIEYKKVPKEWPRDTAMQKALAEYMESGGKPGSGYGIFLM